MTISRNSLAFNFKGNGLDVGLLPLVYSSTVSLFDRNTIIPDGTLVWYNFSDTEKGIGIYRSKEGKVLRTNPFGD